MKVAIIISDSRYSIQSDALRGILDEFSKEEVEASIFTCSLPTGFVCDAEDKDESRFMLVNYEDYDGFVLYADTIPDRELVNAIAQEIRKTGKPAISIKDKIDGLLSMEIDNTAGIKNIIRHIVEDLGKRRIFFLAGPEYNNDSSERLNAYREALSSYGIEPEDGWIIYGTYHPHSGRQALKRWYKRQNELPMPEAIVCANDEMALGVCLEAREYGINIPEELIVSGFDNRLISVLCEPALTTVTIPGYEIGAASGRRLLNHMLKRPDDTPDRIKTQTIIRRSTDGSISKGTYNEAVEKVRHHYTNDQIHISNLLDNLKDLESGFASAKNWDDFYDVIKNNIGVFEIRSFYIFTPSREMTPDDRYVLSLLRGEEELTLRKGIEMTVAFAFEDGQAVHYEPFSSKSLIPEVIAKRSRGGYYVIFPLIHSKQLFGYCAVYNSPLAYESEWVALLIQIMSSAFENIRRRTQLEHMVDTLNRLWVYDKLTGVYNRSGFVENVDMILHNARHAGGEAFVLFVDLDRLKYVNDTYGHEAGDSFIIEVSGILKNIFYKEEIIMRYGGDEFVVISIGITEKRARRIETEISVMAENLNSARRYPFPISVSTGHVIGRIADEKELESLIEEADKLMYKNKQSKRGQG